MGDKTETLYRIRDDVREVSTDGGYTWTKSGRVLNPEGKPASAYPVVRVHGVDVYTVAPGYYVTYGCFVGCAIVQHTDGSVELCWWPDGDPVEGFQWHPVRPIPAELKS